MPARARKVGKKWRVVDPDGRIVRNRAGTAVDGGGFSSRQRAQSQAAAINVSKRKRG